MINFTTIIYFCQYLLVTKNNYFIFIISSIYDKLKIIKRLIIRRITGIDNVMLLDDDIKVLNEYLFNKMSKSQKDAVINDVIYYQDSNYQIISGNELKKSLKLKPNSEK